MKKLKLLTVSVLISVNLFAQKFDLQAVAELDLWPSPASPQSMSHLYRHFIMGGYVKGEPVLLTAQGTYGDMAIQAWNPDMGSRWERKISHDEKGAAGSHVTPIVDINEDGVDELLWGERCIELATRKVESLVKFWETKRKS
jgi:hypothetical protein